MGRSTSWTEAAALLLLGTLLGGSPAAQVRVGADRLFEEPYVSWIRNRSVGLVTNQTGVDSRLVPLPALLDARPDVRLAALYAPEHGLDGDLQDGRPVTDSPRVFSLYPEGLTAERLQGVEVLLYDIQDVGIRFYTFISTLLDALRTAGAAGVPVIVLDRPNPLGGMTIEGPLLREELKSFVGAHPIPVRYGLTAGELAGLYRSELGIDVDLRIVPLEGWRRPLRYDETGLQWIAPSPNMPTLRTAEVYGGMGWIEGTNLSEGRGTTRPFELVGAPWLDGAELARRLNALGLAGVRWRAQSFTPMFSKYSGESCRGVQLHVIDRRAFSAQLAVLSLLAEVRRLHPGRLEFRTRHFDRLAGTPEVREALLAGVAPAEIVRRWEEGLTAFRSRWKNALLYPPE